MKPSNKYNFTEFQFIFQLPPTAQYKLITEKCQEFGAVENFEEQGIGSLLVTFMTEWDAERAMSILLYNHQNFILLTQDKNFAMFSLTLFLQKTLTGRESMAAQLTPELSKHRPSGGISPILEFVVGPSCYSAWSVFASFFTAAILLFIF